MIELPLLLRSRNGKEYILKAMVYVIEADVVFLCGYKTVEHWGANLDIRRKALETCTENETLECNMIKTTSGYYGIKLDTIEKKDNEVTYLDDREDYLTDFKVIR